MTWIITFIQNSKSIGHIDGLVQERCNSTANALELRLSCTNPSISSWYCREIPFLHPSTRAWGQMWIKLVRKNKTLFWNCNDYFWTRPGPHFMNDFFHRNSKSMEISFYCFPSCSVIITLEFSTWHNSCSVVVCAEFYSDTISYNGAALKQNFMEFELWWKNRSWNGSLVISALINTYRWLSARLQYLQCWCTGDTAVVH